MGASAFGLIPIFSVLFLPPLIYTSSRVNKKYISIAKVNPEINIDELEKSLQIYYDMAEKRIFF